MATRSTQALKLTETAIAQAATDQRSLTLKDIALPGFHVNVYPSGMKTYGVVRRNGARQIKLVIGRVGELTLVQARKLAATKLAEIGSGKDLVVERRAQRRAEKAATLSPTLRDAFGIKLSSMKTKRKSPKTMENYEYVLTKYVPDLLDRELATFSRDELSKRHAKLTEQIARNKGITSRARSGGTYQANAVFIAFRSTWKRACLQWPELGLDPAICAAIDWHPTAPCTEVIEDLPAWHASVMGCGNESRRTALMLGVFTGLRRDDLRTLQWANVDLDAGTLRVPKPKGGEKRAFTLPLSRQALALLRAQPRYDDTWVFPGDGRTGHIMDLRERGLIKFQLHAMRRTYITVAETMPLPRYAVQLLTNHAIAKGDVHGSYVHMSVEDLRPVAQAIADEIERRMRPVPAGRVVPLRRRAA